MISSPFRQMAPYHGAVHSDLGAQTLDRSTAILLAVLTSAPQACMVLLIISQTSSALAHAGRAITAQRVRQRRSPARSGRTIWPQTAWQSTVASHAHRGLPQTGLETQRDAHRVPLAPSASWWERRTAPLAHPAAFAGPQTQPVYDRRTKHAHLGPTTLSEARQATFPASHAPRGAPAPYLAAPAVTPVSLVSLAPSLRSVASIAVCFVRLALTRTPPAPPSAVPA